MHSIRVPDPDRPSPLRPRALGRFRLRAPITAMRPRFAVPTVIAHLGDDSGPSANLTEPVMDREPTRSTAFAAGVGLTGTLTGSLPGRAPTTTTWRPT